jgi:formamidopyrimidine-DNA glycosylase
MPELPEVENYRRIAEKALKRPIREAVLSRPKIVTGIPARTLPRLLEGRSFTDARRHGKFLFLKLSKAGWLGMHFGLSGGLTYVKKPRVSKGGSLDMVFKDGSRLRYRALFGRLAVLERPEEFIQKAGLGPDALSLTWAQFKKLADSRKKLPAKQLFMDQRNIAGVGNLYSDEALFLTRIHPLTRAGNIPTAKLKRLYANLRKVLKAMVAIRKRGEWLFPKGYIAPSREKGSACPRCRAKLKTVRIGGRVSFFCPKEQAAA